MVDKEMTATSTAIEEAVLRMDVRTRTHCDRYTWHTSCCSTALSQSLFLRRSWVRRGETLVALSWRSTKSKTNTVSPWNYSFFKLFSFIFLTCDIFLSRRSILGSCSDLMKVRSLSAFSKCIFVNSWFFFTLFISSALLFSLQAVHMLVTASTDLQKDIVEGGRVSRRDTASYKVQITV